MKLLTNLCQLLSSPVELRGLTIIKLTNVFVIGVYDQTQVIEPDGLLVLSEGILTERAQ